MSTKIAVLVSGGGTNLQALIDAQKDNRLGGGEIICVISSKPDVYAITRAEENDIRCICITRKSYPTPEDYSDAILEILNRFQIDLVVLAGFMSILKGDILTEYTRRILNVHPSLIPSFCGEAHYGLKVHAAALDYGVKVTGATVHFVDSVVDGGEIVLQKAVDVKRGDTPKTLQQRVMEEAEWDILPKAVALFCAGEL